MSNTISITEDFRKAISNSPCAIWYDSRNLGIASPDDIAINVSFTSNPVGSHATGEAPVAYINSMGEIEITISFINFDKHRVKTLLQDFVQVGTQVTSVTDTEVGTLEYVANPKRATEKQLVIYPHATNGTDAYTSDTNNPRTIYIPMAVVTDAETIELKSTEANMYTYTFKTVFDPMNDYRGLIIGSGVAIVEGTSTTYTPPA